MLLTLTLSHYLTLSLSHSFNLSFNHSRHAEQVLFSCLGSKVAVYSWKLQWFFFYLLLLITLSCDTWVHRAGSQLKTCALCQKRPSLFRQCSASNGWNIMSYGTMFVGQNNANSHYTLYSYYFNQFDPLDSAKYFLSLININILGLQDNLKLLKIV